MLAKTYAEVESDALTDLPPSNWYTDPTDESQYRYWDGSAWTEHRAPRHAEAATGGLRSSGDLLGDSFSLMRRQWRGCALAALVSIVGQVIFAALAFIAVNEILMGELGEVWERISQPGFDPTTPDNEAYLESLEFDFSLASFAPLVLALPIYWVASNLFRATIVLLTLGDLRGRATSLSVVLRQALRRVPRLMGLDLQLLALGIAALTITVLGAFLSPALLILFIPALAVAVILMIAVLLLAYVVASAGPSESSLRYAVRLVRGRFWGTLGRMLLVLLVVVVINLAISTVFGLATSSLGALSWSGQVVSTVTSAVLGLLMTVASVIIYHDLGGESD